MCFVTPSLPTPLLLTTVHDWAKTCLCSRCMSGVVLLGVPQEKPLMFVLCINDLPSVVNQRYRYPLTMLFCIVRTFLCMYSLESLYYYNQ